VLFRIERFEVDAGKQERVTIIARLAGGADEYAAYERW